MHFLSFFFLILLIEFSSTSNFIFLHKFIILVKNKNLKQNQEMTLHSKRESHLQHHYSQGLETGQVDLSGVITPPVQTLSEAIEINRSIRTFKADITIANLHN